MSSVKTGNEGYIEDVLCHESEMEDRQMKVFNVGTDGGKVLLIRENDQFYAIGTKCTHYGAPLNTGALGEGGRVRCPWHGACFNIKTGDIEDHPGLDSLPTYQVSKDDKGILKVRAKISDLKCNRRMKDMCELKEDHPETVVIVGGGPASAACAETLRQECFEGRIVMVCKEDVLPYDRVKVSKAVDFDVQKHLLRSQQFYDNINVETKLGVEATGLDTDDQIVSLDNGEELHYDHLFIATGSKPRIPEIPGFELPGVMTIRDYADAKNLVSMLGTEKDKNVVILGAGFIGMEVAAYCSDKCASVTIVARDDVPFRALFGPEIGKRILTEFEKNESVTFIPDSGILEFVGKEDCGELVLDTVILRNETSIPADIAIVGIGSTFNTDWVKNSIIHLQDNCSITVDEYLRTNVDNVYAGGDLAFAPVFASDTSAAIGHFSLAEYHGRIAAMNICKKETKLKTVPFFWTTLFGKSYRYSGHGRLRKTKVLGSLDDLEFFAYHIEDGKVMAMSSVGTDPIVADYANYVFEGKKKLTEKAIDKDPTAWMRYTPKGFEPAAPLTSRFQQRRDYHTLRAEHLIARKYVNAQCFKYSKFVGSLRFLRKLIL